VQAGALATVPTLAGFAITAAAVLIRAARGEAARQALPRDDAPALRVGDPLVEAVLAGLPDGVALDRHGDVVALNARARRSRRAAGAGAGLAGAARPEVLNAIRRAVAAGNSQRVEFFEGSGRSLVRGDRHADRVGGAAPAGLVLVTFTISRRCGGSRDARDFIAMRATSCARAGGAGGFIETLQGSAPTTRRRGCAFLPIMQAQRPACAIDRRSPVACRASSSMRTCIRTSSRPRRHHARCGQLQTLARDRGVTSTSSPRPRIVIWRPRRIDAGVQNLIENALKYAASASAWTSPCRSMTAASPAREALVECAITSRHPPSICAPDRALLPVRRHRKAGRKAGRPRPGAGQALSTAMVAGDDQEVAGQGATFTAHLPWAEATSVSPHAPALLDLALSGPAKA